MLPRNIRHSIALGVRGNRFHINQAEFGTGWSILTALVERVRPNIMLCPDGGFIAALRDGLQACNRCLDVRVAMYVGDTMPPTSSIWTSGAPLSLDTGCASNNLSARSGSDQSSISIRSTKDCSAAAAAAAAAAAPMSPVIKIRVFLVICRILRTC